VLVLVDADADAYLVSLQRESTPSCQLTDLVPVRWQDKYNAGDPAEGGKLAAVDLRAAVQQYVKSVDPRLGSVPIMARAFAPGDGLATLLAKAGIANPGDSQYVLSRFTRGFSQADELFDFVIVGKGKDRADNKLMGQFSPESFPPCPSKLLREMTYRRLSFQGRFGSLSRARAASMSSSLAATTMVMSACWKNGFTTRRW
jgi:hypothetical protein